MTINYQFGNAEKNGASTVAQPPGLWPAVSRARSSPTKKGHMSL